jgi:hypothetical protein
LITRRLQPFGVCAAILVVAALAATGAPSAGASTAPVLRVGCNNIIGSYASASRLGERELFGRVVVPPRRLQRAASLHEMGWPFFAKQGVTISTQSRGATITVARGSQREAAISWGNGLRVARSVVFRRCAGSEHRWNAYAGGLFTRTRTACVGLVVRVGSRSRTIHVGVGRRCPA